MNKKQYSIFNCISSYTQTVNSLLLADNLPLNQWFADFAATFATKSPPNMTIQDIMTNITYMKEWRQSKKKRQLKLGFHKKFNMFVVYEYLNKYFKNMFSISCSCQHQKKKKDPRPKHVHIWALQQQML